uniref:hypothetical protein 25 n=1 Tax=Moniliophthora perniciosa TaxID=153609 RepID=UPI0000242368|nr:hypothetical protein 25 [Moniliophthora perniciosa]AAQ74315.1 hypothetical protein 25 [Moniliophthora perniciosa]
MRSKQPFPSLALPCYPKGGRGKRERRKPKGRKHFLASLALILTGGGKGSEAEEVLLGTAEIGGGKGKVLPLHFCCSNSASSCSYPQLRSSADKIRARKRRSRDKSKHPASSFLLAKQEAEKWSGWKGIRSSRWKEGGLKI